MPTSQIYQQIFTLTDAQIKALPSTPVEIIAAPGANKCIFPLFAMLRLAWTADYTNIDGTATISILNGVQGILSQWAEAVGSGVSGILAGGGPDGSWGWSLLSANASITTLRSLSNIYDSDIANLPINISATNGALGNFQGGDVANGLEGTLHYMIVDF